MIEEHARQKKGAIDNKIKIFILVLKQGCKRVTEFAIGLTLQRSAFIHLYFFTRRLKSMALNHNIRWFKQKNQNMGSSTSQA